MHINQSTSGAAAVKMTLVAVVVVVSAECGGANVRVLIAVFVRLYGNLGVVERQSAIAVSMCYKTIPRNSTYFFCSSSRGLR